MTTAERKETHTEDGRGDITDEQPRNSERSFFRENGFTILCTAVHLPAPKKQETSEEDDLQTNVSWPFRLEKEMLHT